MVVSSLASKYKTRVEVNGSGKHSSMATITALNSCIVQALVVGGYWADLNHQSHDQWPSGTPLCLRFWPFCDLYYKHIMFIHIASRFIS